MWRSGLITVQLVPTLQVGKIPTVIARRAGPSAITEFLIGIVFCSVGLLLIDIVFFN